jgi:hypothetical protein
MPNTTTISQLSSAGTLSVQNDLLPIVNNGITRKVVLSALFDSIPEKPFWDSVYNNVNSLSSTWGDKEESVYSIVNLLSTNWESVYYNVNTLSSFNESVYNNVNYLSSFNESVYNNVNSLSSYNESVYNNVNSLSSFNESVYNNVNSLSSYNESVYNNVNSLSSFNESVYNNVNSLSSFNESVYNNVNSLSSYNESVYNNVNSLSTIWTSASGSAVNYSHNNFLPLSGTNSSNNSSAIEGKILIKGNVLGLPRLFVSGSLNAGVNGTYVVTTDIVNGFPVFKNTASNQTIFKNPTTSPAGWYLSTFHYTTSEFPTGSWSNIPFSGQGAVTSSALDPLPFGDLTRSALTVSGNVSARGNLNVHGNGSFTGTLSSLGNISTNSRILSAGVDISSVWKDILTFDDTSQLPLSGEFDKIYYLKNIDKFYRWGNAVIPTKISVIGAGSSIVNGVYTRGVDVDNSPAWYKQSQDLKKLGDTAWYFTPVSTTSIATYVGGDLFDKSPVGVTFNTSTLGVLPAPTAIAVPEYIDILDFAINDIESKAKKLQFKRIVSTLPQTSNDLVMPLVIPNTVYYINKIYTSNYTPTLPLSSICSTGDRVVVVNDVSSTTGFLNVRVSDNNSNYFNGSFTTLISLSAGRSASFYFTENKWNLETITPHTHLIAEITNLQTALDSKATSFDLANYLPLSGGTIVGNASFTGTLSSLGNISTNSRILSAGVDVATLFSGNGGNISNYDSVYNNVNSLSTVWTSASGASVTYSHNSFLPLSGGILNGDVTSNNNLTVYGTLSVSGGTFFGNTYYTTTSALSVLHFGSGDALWVGNFGSGHIASFNDVDAGVEVLHIGGENSSYPNVGVKTGTPNETLTVLGNISASNIIYNGNGNSTNWNKAFTDVGTLSGNVDLKINRAGDTMTGKLNLPASTTTSASLNIQSGVAPTSPVNGDIWFVSNVLNYRSTGEGDKTIVARENSNTFTNSQTINTSNTAGVALSVTNSSTATTTPNRAAEFTASAGNGPVVTITQNGNGRGLHILNRTGSGESLRIEDESPESTPFVVSATGKVGIGTEADSTVGLKLDSTGIKFSDDSIQTTAGVAKTGDTMTGVLSVSNGISTGVLSANNIKINQATIQTFVNPVTASGEFLVLNINGTNRAIRLWDFTS